MALVLFSAIVVYQNWNIWNQIQLHKKEAVVLTHRSRNTILLHQTGDSLAIISPDTVNLGSIATDYAVAERIQKVGTSTLQNSYSIGRKRLFVMDSLGILPLEEEEHPDYLLLTQSPKVNLERLLDSVKPKMVLADGSNYRSVVSRWEETCAQKEIPFHYSGEKGYYVFSLEED